MRRKEARDYRPPCMLPAEQSFIQDLLGHMTLIFEERTDNTLSYSIERTLLMSICWSSRNISRNSEKAGLSAHYSHMGPYDAVFIESDLHNFCNVLGAQLFSQMIRVVMKVIFDRFPTTAGEVSLEHFAEILPKMDPSLLSLRNGI
ncbi:unnamed protein product [Albugo candida]|uniref:Uncharacterized protein n=1 Tax=Albugo candida TaxID=65357 RepID=A0A024G6W3_9STRA|nr:unnamed protein product [Albugo candida]|eukprot:CCI42060.1 unnamed protein product [Albugo candida]